MKLHIWAPGFTGFGGGITVFSRELALGLKEQGHDVQLFGKHDHAGAWPGFQLWGTAHYATSLKTPRFAAGCLSSAARHKPDYIISTHVNFGPAANLARKFFDLPYCLVAHGIDIHPELPARTIESIRKADKIIAVSAWTRERVLALGGVDPSRIDVLPNTFDESRFGVASKPKALTRRYGISDKAKIVLSVARLDATERYKGYDRLIRSLPRLEQECGPIHFILVGEGEDKQRADAVSKVLGVERHVTFAGFVADDELADHYRLADVFAMPSTGEGFGIVFLEAMGCGTPVVAGNRDGSVDALAGGELGVLVNPESVDEIIAGIKQLVRCEGPVWWFNRSALHQEIVNRFGRTAFRERLCCLFPMVEPADPEERETGPLDNLARQ
ncbi:MAG TPA: glycosyltransferase family 4 protein [Gemmatimonadaceae bacterium]|nr:glycosyltransferase family 4 protein [Gemmatimonadaceae bacterium]